MVFWDQIVIKILSILTLIGTGLIVLFLIDLILFYFIKKHVFEASFRYISKKSLFFIFIISFFATFGSLLFSDLLKFEPCVLCWYQRILMYPQFILSLIALMRKEKKIIYYLYILSLIGAIIAGYQYYSQVSGVSYIPCSALGNSVSCSEYFFLEFGYITIPMMTLVAFLLIIILSFL